MGSSNAAEPGTAAGTGRGSRSRVVVLLGVGLVVAGGCWWLWGGAASLEEARAAVGAGQTDRAIALLREYVAAEPDDSEGWLLLGRCLQRTGDTREAARAYGQVTAESTSWREAGRQRAVLLLRAGDFQAGEVAMTAWLERFPDSPEAVMELYWVYFVQLRERDCERLLEGALERRPASFDYLRHLLYGAQKKPVAQESLENLERAAQAVPGQAVINLALGRCYWQLGDSRRAWPLLEAALRERPDDVETVVVAAEFLLEQGRDDEAAAVLLPQGEQATELIERYSDDDRWWWLRSRLRLQWFQFALALELIDQALERRPRELKYVQGQGSMRQATGQMEAARVSLELAAELAAADRALYELVHSGAIENPTLADCLAIAGHLETLGRTRQAEGWRKIVKMLQQSGVSRTGLRDRSS